MELVQAEKSVALFDHSQLGMHLVGVPLRSNWMALPSTCIHLWWASKLGGMGWSLQEWVGDGMEALGSWSDFPLGMLGLGGMEEVDFTSRAVPLQKFWHLVGRAPVGVGTCLSSVFQSNRTPIFSACLCVFGLDDVGAFFSLSIW